MSSKDEAEILDSRCCVFLDDFSVCRKGNRIERAFSFERNVSYYVGGYKGRNLVELLPFTRFFLYLSRETYTYNPALVTLVGASFLANLSMVDATGIN